jgi:hypothetical protein
MGLRNRLLRDVLSHRSSTLQLCNSAAHKVLRNYVEILLCCATSQLAAYRSDSCSRSTTTKAQLVLEVREQK